MVDTIAMRLWRRRLILGWLVTLVAAGQGLADHALLYQVSRDGAPPSYLVGTMHSEDARVTGLLDEFAPMIAQVDTVALEMLPDAVTMLAVGAATLLPFDQSLRGLIGQTRFDALTAAARDLGLPIEMLNRLKPWAAAVMLGMPATKSGRFLDMEIYLHALATQRRTVGLETAAEQLAVFDAMTQDVQLTLLDEMIKNAGALPRQMEELTEAYLAGDLDLLDQAARAQYLEMPPVVRQWFDERLLDERNQRMLARLLPLIDEGTAFIAIGALHLGGKTGLIAGLRRHGFRVERWRG
jgi:uncharacterized protein YbaP (TraB family)